MHALLRELLGSGPVVTDGAWGTQLQAEGLSLGECPDVWNISNPQKVFTVAHSYVDAGSQVILTNTFGANGVRLAEQGIAEKAQEINRRGVEISREASGGRAKVFASIGPSGKLLLTGDTSAKELESAFAEQAEALAQAGAHGLVIETMSDLDEALLAVRAAQATGLPVVASMVFDSGKARDRTLMGQAPEQIATALAAAGADVIGANCGQGIAGFIHICKRLRSATDRPIWIKPNAGLPSVVEGKAIYSVTAAEFSSFVPALIEAGASFIGGCCGTSPEFISAMVSKLRPRSGIPDG
ncbi:MAG TPA: homocysteine S-methyltransferase family protein [Verrucomicrobiae bacterium]|nr:homocysteine S-methyltransferase family protein [Verrucomicrobiae bacterium]